MKFTPCMNSWRRGTKKKIVDSLFPRAFLGKKKKKKKKERERVRERKRGGDREKHVRAV